MGIALLGFVVAGLVLGYVGSLLAMWIITALIAVGFVSLFVWTNEKLGDVVENFVLSGGICGGLMVLVMWVTAALAESFSLSGLWKLLTPF